MILHGCSPMRGRRSRTHLAMLGPGYPRPRIVPVCQVQAICGAAGFILDPRKRGVASLQLALQEGIECDGSCLSP